MERVSDEWLNEVIPKYSAIDSKSRGCNVYLALCELKSYRQAERSSRSGKMEQISDEWIEKAITSYKKWEAVYKDFSSEPMAMRTALEELQSRRKVEKEQRYTDHSVSEKDGVEATQEREKTILPLPVKSVDGVSMEKWTVKDWFQKINEELDELKEVLLRWSDLDSIKLDTDYVDDEDYKTIADEGADTITAITSMLEAMGIDERQRQEAQRRANERNRERERL